VIDAVSKSKDRIYSMALIHTKLYQSSNLTSINFGEYINELVTSVIDSYSLNNNIKCDVSHTNTVFNIDLCINLGIIITELLTNAYKHAFKNKTEGLVKVQLISTANTKHKLIIEDNGTGMKENLDINNPQTLGLEIVSGLIDQIDGTIETSSQGGLKYVIRFESSKPIR